MKTTIFTLLLLSTYQSIGMISMPITPGGSVNQQCAYYNVGTVEAHGPHTTLEQCQANHESCQKRCFGYQYSCTVTGQHEEVERLDDGSLQTVHAQTTYTSMHTERSAAREAAMGQCESEVSASGAPINDSCTLKSCQEVAVRTQ